MVHQLYERQRKSSVGRSVGKSQTQTQMKVQNQVLVENIVGWAAADDGFKHDGYKWCAEWNDDGEGDERTLDVWGVEISSGLRRHDFRVDLTSGRFGDTVETVGEGNGAWDTIVEAFTSKDAE